MSGSLPLAAHREPRCGPCHPSAQQELPARLGSLPVRPRESGPIPHLPIGRPCPVSRYEMKTSIPTFTESLCCEMMDWPSTFLAELSRFGEGPGPMGQPRNRRSWEMGL